MADQPLKPSGGRPLKYPLNPNKVNDGAGKWCTICDVHRRMWRLIDRNLAPDDPLTALKLKRLIAEAYDLGKRMDRQLRASVGDEYWRGLWEPARAEDTYKELAADGAKT